MRNIFVIFFAALISLSAINGGNISSYLSSLLAKQPTSVQQAVLSELSSLTSFDTKTTSFQTASLSSLVSSILNDITETSSTTTTETSESTSTETVTQSAAAMAGQSNGAVWMTVIGLVASFVLFMAL